MINIIYDEYLKLIIIILIIIFNFNIVYLKKKYHFFFCYHCIDREVINFECTKCTTSTLFNTIIVKSRDETLNEIVYKGKSIARFGDGEFGIIFGKNIKFQKYNKTLKDKLLKVLNSNNPNLLVGIIPLIAKNGFWYDWMKDNKFKVRKIINENKIYYSAHITRFYYPNIDKNAIKNYIIKFKQIWNKRNILIIEGEKTRLGVGNDLFDNSKSIERIICPVENAFSIYDKLVKYVMKLKLDKKTLILISLGPTATILVYDFLKLGNQIIDFGHFDIHYEYYLRNATKPIIIPNKYVNEVIGGSANITSITDKKYYQQIIYRIF